MIGKSVKVFWPVDECWYSGCVQAFNAEKGEHLLKYPDGDVEWVKIGDIIQANNNSTANMKQEDLLSAISAPPQPQVDLVKSSNEGGVHDPSKQWGSHPPTGVHPPELNAYAAAAYPTHYGGMAPGAYPPPNMMPYMYAGHPVYPPPMFPGMAMPADVNKDTSPSSQDSGRSKKAGPKPWSKDEDALLVRLVHSMQWPMKWTVVAQNLPDRTGKQCRERYVNHLNPRLKNTEWTASEDATIFHLYNTLGSHWAKMSKVIPGRTDNGIKNRFHNIRRQYEREDSHRLKLNCAEDFPDDIRLDRIRKFPEHLSGKSTSLWDMQSSVGVLAAQSVAASSSNTNANANRSSRSGPFRAPEPDEICVRCGLLVPSVHTGNEICTKTGWCASCTRVPPNISGNLLRECLNLRRADTKVTRKIVESWEELFKGEATDKTKQKEYVLQAADDE